jgi:hypothetical protein
MSGKDPITEDIHTMLQMTVLALVELALPKGVRSSKIVLLKTEIHENISDS